MSEGNGVVTAKRQLWVTTAGLAVVLVGSLIGMYVKIDAADRSAQESAAQLKEVERRMDRLSTQSDANRIDIASLKRDGLETETQLCAIEEMRNMMHVNDIRTTSVMWRKVYGSDYPAGTTYFPIICNRGRGVTN
jgi:ACT domain-containing protein